jgi:hypothetical protein
MSSDYPSLLSVFNSMTSIMQAGSPGKSPFGPMIAYVKYFQIIYGASTTVNGPGDNNIFRQLYYFAGGDLEKMGSWGVAIYPDENTIGLDSGRENCRFAKKPSGYYLIVSTNNQQGPGNTYCPVNPQWVPEWLVCGDSAIQGWWTQDPVPNWDCRKSWPS